LDGTPGSDPLLSLTSSFGRPGLQQAEAILDALLALARVLVAERLATLHLLETERIWAAGWAGSTIPVSPLPASPVRADTSSTRADVQ